MKVTLSFLIISLILLSAQLQAGCRDKADCELLPVPVIEIKKIDVENKKIEFDGSKSYARGKNTIVKFMWEFGDGSPPTGSIVNPSHPFPNVNRNYQVKLTVKDNKGKENSITQEVSFNIPLSMITFEDQTENTSFPDVIEVQEDAGTIDVKLLITKPISKNLEVKVSLNAPSSSATHIIDFQGTNILFEGEEGDEKFAIISILPNVEEYPMQISIVGDKLIEPTEDFELSIIEVNNLDVGIGPINKMTVKIIDDDLGEVPCDGETGSYYTNPDTTEGCFISDTFNFPFTNMTLPEKDTGCQLCGTGEIVSNGAPIEIAGFIYMKDSRIVGTSLDNSVEGIKLNGEITLINSLIADNISLDGKIYIEDSQLGNTADDELVEVVGDVVIDGTIIGQNSKINGDGKIKGANIGLGQPEITGQINIQGAIDYTGVSIAGNPKIGPNVRIEGSFININDNAKVLGSSSILGDANGVYENAEINDNVSLSGQGIHIKGNARVLDNVKIKSENGVVVKDSALVFGNATLYDLSLIGGGVNIFGEAKIKKSTICQNLNIDYNIANQTLCDDFGAKEYVWRR